MIKSGLKCGKQLQMFKIILKANNRIWAYLSEHMRKVTFLCTTICFTFSPGNLSFHLHKEGCLMQTEGLVVRTEGNLFIKIHQSQYSTDMSIFFFQVSFLVGCAQNFLLDWVQVTCDNHLGHFVILLFFLSFSYYLLLVVSPFNYVVE